MIHLKKNGPMGYASHEASIGRLRFVGVGGAGISTVDQIVLRHQELYHVVAIDTDQQAIDATVAPEKHLLGREQTGGLGCAGERDRAEEIAAAATNLWELVADGCEYLVVCTGCGGGTGVAFAVALAQAASRKRIKVLVLAALPYQQEGKRRQARAAADLRQLRQVADCVLAFANDRMAETPLGRDNLRTGFYVLNELMARTAESIELLLAKRGLMQLGFADVRSLFGRFQGGEALENCWAGYAEVPADASGLDLAEAILDGPVLSNEAVWAKADHAIITLAGGHDLSLSEVQTVLDELQRRLPRQMPVAVNANLEEKSQGLLRLTLLLAMTQPDPEAVSQVPVVSVEMSVVTIEEKVAALSKLKGDTQRITEALKPAARDQELLEEEEASEPMLPMAGITDRSRMGKHIAKQEELPLENASRGHFEKSHETIYNGENLDLPTFRRRRIAIRL